MGGGNGQKAKMAREKNLEKQKAAKGSQLESNKKAMSIQVRFLQTLGLICFVSLILFRYFICYFSCKVPGNLLILLYR
ncbi:hypothetical protein TorRG33x02_136290 [Trema orientale]|uniref:Small EDRK-rich factor-like N-terminal domain-containing protein n=1 Tax=Trema orientale TaxID=63057 RepID=A0A2P5EYH2_TREOI|nr:hypothetical protein TorRG33x02_136290 [Trema orientale]